MLLLALLTLAHGEGAGTLPAGSATAYGGLGLGTFQYGSSGRIRDRQWRARADFYGAAGLTDRLQLSLDGPFAVNWVQEIDDRGPCPTDAFEGDYCDTTVTAGEIGRHARYRVIDGLAVGLGARTDAWNAGTRGRWTNGGLGTTSLVGSVVGGYDWPEVSVVAAGQRPEGRPGFRRGRPSLVPAQEPLTGPPARFLHRTSPGPPDARLGTAGGAG